MIARQDKLVIAVEEQNRALSWPDSAWTRFGVGGFATRLAAKIAASPPSWGAWRLGQRECQMATWAKARPRGDPLVCTGLNHRTQSKSIRNLLLTCISCSPHRRFDAATQETPRACPPAAPSRSRWGP